MLAKALFIDFKKEAIAPQYFARIKKLFKSTQFISRDDSKLPEGLKDTEAIFCKISTKIDKGVINAAPRLKYIGVCSTAFDAIDVKYARSKKSQSVI